MKKSLAVTGMMVCPPDFAQQPAVCPAHGQSAGKQQRDRAACQAWSKQSAGIDLIIGDAANNNVGYGPAADAMAGALSGGLHSRREHAAHAQASANARQSALNSYWRVYGPYTQGCGDSVQ